MAAESKSIFAGTVTTVPSVSVKVPSLTLAPGYRRYFVAAQVFIVLALLELALWTPSLAVRNRWVAVTAMTIVILTLVDRPSLRKLGLILPSGFGAALVLVISIAGAAFMVGMVSWAGGDIPVNPTWPNLHVAWEYVLWAMIQEFILQSFFYSRCEELFGSINAVWVTATLFAVAHLPSPVLTTATLIGALFFCEMFRRYRSIYPIGLVHGLLGLTIAMVTPDSLLHHMRVGIGYLTY